MVPAGSAGSAILNGWDSSLSGEPPSAEPPSPCSTSTIRNESSSGSSLARLEDESDGDRWKGDGVLYDVPFFPPADTGLHSSRFRVPDQPKDFRNLLIASAMSNLRASRKSSYRSGCQIAGSS